MVLETYKTENTKEIEHNIPISICDYCSKYFYEGDYRLVQISNECIVFINNKNRSKII